MTILEVGHSVLVMPNLLLNLNELRLGWQRGTRKQVGSLIEDMKDVMQPRDRCEVLPVRQEVLAGEAWQQAEVGLLMDLVNG